MTVATIRPDATVSSATVSAVGAGSLHAAVNDNSDGSYALPGAIGGVFVVGLAEPTLPAGAVMKALTLRARTGTNTAAPTQSRLDLMRDGEPILYWQIAVGWAAPTTTQSLTIPFTGGLGTLTLRVLQNSGGGPDVARIYELYLDVTYVERPAVTVTKPADGTTLTNRNVPTVSWTPALDLDGGPQTAYAVRIYSEAQYTDPRFDPATALLGGRAVPVAGSGAAAAFNVVEGTDTLWYSSIALPNGTYRAYVHVQQQLGGTVHASPWAYTRFVVDVDAPSVPNVVATPEDELARIRLVATAPRTVGVVDTFDTDTLASYQVSGGGLAVTGGNLTVTTTAVKELLHNGQTYDDCTVVWQITPGAATTWTVRCVGRATATAQLHAMLRREPAPSPDLTDLLAIVLRPAGRSDVFLRSVTTPVPDPARTYWLLLRTDGNDITAEWWDLDPLNLGPYDPMDPDAPLASCTHTLAGGNIALVGKGVSGRSGGILEPGGTDVRYGTFTSLSYYPRADRFEFERSDDAGVTWAPIRTPLGDDGLVNVPGLVVEATVWDFEAPNGVEVRHRVRSLHNYSGLYAASAWAVVRSQWADTERVWLKNPYDPSKSMLVTMQSFPARARAARTGVVQPLGAAGVVASTDTRGPETGTLVLRVAPSEHARLDALLDDAVPLLLVAPRDWPVPFPFYFVVTGDTQRTNPGDKAMFTWTLDTLGWTRVDRPRGGLLMVPAA